MGPVKVFVSCARSMLAQVLPAPQPRQLSTPCNLIFLDCNANYQSLLRSHLYSLPCSSSLWQEIKKAKFSSISRDSTMWDAGVHQREKNCVFPNTVERDRHFGWNDKLLLGPKCPLAVIRLAAMANRYSKWSAVRKWRLTVIREYLVCGMKSFHLVRRRHNVAL